MVRLWAAVLMLRPPGVWWSGRTQQPATALAVLAVLCMGATCPAKPDNLADLVRVANPGDVLVLEAGDYGTWEGTDKAITLKAADGAEARVALDIEPGDRGFTLDGLTITKGTITSPTDTPPETAVRDITIRNSRFTGHLWIGGVTDSNILLENNTHRDINTGPGDWPARVVLSYPPFYQPHSGVTIRDSLFAGGDSDGVQSGAGVNIVGNEFSEIVPAGPNHTDNVQLVNGAHGAVVRGNYIHASVETQGIGVYQGLEKAVIEDNVVDIRRFAGIEIYSDDGSTIAHNTVSRPQGCAPRVCGIIDITSLPSQDPGVGTVVRNNVATYIKVKPGTGVTLTGNMVQGYIGPADYYGWPLYVGGSNPASYAGFRLREGTVGYGRAGIR